MANGAKKISTPPLKRDSFLESSRDPLSTPIQYVPGVGPHRATLLAKIGVQTAEDLLGHFPRDHQDRRLQPIREARPEQKIAISGTVLSVTFKRIGRHLAQARAFIKDESSVMEAIWFKRPSFKYDVFSGLRKLLVSGQRVNLFGQVVVSNDCLALRVDHAEPPSDQWGLTLHTNGLVPVYPLTEGLYEERLRELIHKSVQRFAHLVPDPLPESLRRSQNLLSKKEAVTQYHFPKTWTERDQARERLAFEEFFFLELALAISRQHRQHQSNGTSFLPTRKKLTPFKEQLGYEFTQAQSRVINEIFRDMAKSTPMNRLLQGDVGAGKTVVALSAILLAIENKKQAAFLAPTEILAGQHAISIQKFFHGLGVRWALLTRSTPMSERKKIIQKIKAKEIDLLIGTHAILNEKIEFDHLGLVVIDEQHRFGVRQRARLVNATKTTSDMLDDAAAHRPDMLIMTATPIPRTLALTLYGDLDVSVLDEMPKGRTPIQTACAPENQALQVIEETVRAKNQAFVVFPLIDESERLQKKGKFIKAAKKEFDRLVERFSSLRLALLHGQMSGEEKKKIMESFRSGDIDVLVSTPVIEVGIDVPNAALMVIMSPERFGLAQLHQLRGRVGRGDTPSRCLLVVDEEKGARSQRLSIFCSTTNGFRLAEEDLKLRGPGEILGEAQHGVPFFRVGDLIRDALLISQAREAAKRLVEGEWSLTMKEFGVLNRTLQKRFGNKIQLSSIG